MAWRLLMPAFLIPFFMSIEIGPLRQLSPLLPGERRLLLRALLPISRVHMPETEAAAYDDLFDSI